MHKYAEQNTNKDRKGDERLVCKMELQSLSIFVYQWLFFKTLKGFPTMVDGCLLDQG